MLEPGDLASTKIEFIRKENAIGKLRLYFEKALEVVKDTDWDEEGIYVLEMSLLFILKIIRDLQLQTSAVSEFCMLYEDFPYKYDGQEEMLDLKDIGLERLRSTFPCALAVLAEAEAVIEKNNRP